MCGVFAVISNDNKAGRYTIEGLKKLEYRGYDSAGIAILDNNKIFIKKSAEKESISKLSLEVNSFPNSSISLAHTRWATHGGVSERNAHPHSDKKERFTLVQNGVLENFLEIKKELINNGYEFLSETDTECIVALISKELDKGEELSDAVRNVFLKLDGRNTIVVLDSKNKRLIGIRNGSPLIFGYSDDILILSSDLQSLKDRTEKGISLDNNEMIIIENNGKFIFKNAQTGEEISKNLIEHSNSIYEKNEEILEHHMITEILQSSRVVLDCINQPKEKLEEVSKIILNSKHVYVTGMGTAFNAGKIIIQNFLQNGIFALGDEASNFIYKFRNHINKDDVVIFISQSGETADTLQVLDFVKSKNITTISIVNAEHSSLQKATDYSFLTNAGTEIGVASTKAFSSQAVLGTLLGIKNRKRYINEVKDFSESLKEFFLDKNNIENIKDICEEIKGFKDFFILGRSSLHPAAQEAELKLMEVTYKSFHAKESRELKHGPLAMIDEEVLTLMLIPNNEESLTDSISAMQQIKARGGKIMAIGTKKQISFLKENCKDLFELSIIAPKTDSEALLPVSLVISIQLLSYFMATSLGYNPDKPRNLAKSVTVV